MTRLIITLTLSLASVLLSSCGKSNDDNNNPNPVVAGQGGCSAGYVYSAQYGCVPQSCPAGTALYNGACTSGTVAGGCPVGTVQTATGCVAQGGNNGGYNYCPVGQVLYHGTCVNSHYYGQNGGANVPPYGYNGGAYNYGYYGYYNAGYGNSAYNTGYPFGYCSAFVNGACIR